MKFCPECGFKLQEESKFCPSCGKQLAQEHAPVVPPVAAADSKPVEITVSKPKKNYLFPIIGLVVITLIGAAAALFLRSSKSFSDDPAAIEKASSSVVLLDCLDEGGKEVCTGSAFSAFEKGVFVTNYHVIGENVAKIVAHTENGTMFEIDSIVAFDKEKDIAILSTSAALDVSPLPIGNVDELTKGEKVVAIGSPLGFINTVSTGVFSGLNQAENLTEIQFNASISHGSSGGALFNDRGEVIGITYGSYEGGQNLNVAVPIHYVEVLKENASAPITVKTFFDQYSIKTYSVDDILRNRTSLSTGKAKVVGYIASIKDKECVLVANIRDVEEYLEIEDEITSKSNLKIASAKDWLENYGKIYDRESDFELTKAIFISDSTLGKVNSFKNLQVGDCISIVIHTRSIADSSVFHTYIIKDTEVELIN